MTKQELKKQYDALKTDALIWVKDGDGQKAKASGFDLVIAQVVKDAKPTSQWAWSVATKTELVAKDIAGSEGGAKRSASRSARKAQQAKAAQIVVAQEAATPAPAAKATESAPTQVEVDGTVVAETRRIDAAKPAAAKTAAVSLTGDALLEAARKAAGPAPSVKPASATKPPAAKKAAAKKPAAKKAAAKPPEKLAA